jgi:hypothetical protein
MPKAKPLEEAILQPFTVPASYSFINFKLITLKFWRLIFVVPGRSSCVTAAVNGGNYSRPLAGRRIALIPGGDTIRKSKGLIMMGTDFNSLFTNINPWLFTLLVVWSIAWKGWALWRAARLKHLGWYIVLLVVNLAGILEIIYIAISKREYKEFGERVR